MATRIRLQRHGKKGKPVYNIVVADQRAPRDGKYIEKLGVKHINNLNDALEWCDIANILRIQLERQDAKYFPSLREYAMVFGINKEILMNLNKEITIMHPGPINRGVELTSDVADSGQSIILDQVENGVAIRMAILYLLASKITKNGR